MKRRKLTKEDLVSLREQYEHMSFADQALFRTRRPSDYRAITRPAIEDAYYDRRSLLATHTGDADRYPLHNAYDKEFTFPRVSISCVL